MEKEVEMKKIIKYQSLAEFERDGFKFDTLQAVGRELHVVKLIHGLPLEKESGSSKKLNIDELFEKKGYVLPDYQTLLAGALKSETFLNKLKGGLIPLNNESLYHLREHLDHLTVMPKLKGSYDSWDLGPRGGIKGTEGYYYIIGKNGEITRPAESDYNKENTVLVSQGRGPLSLKVYLDGDTKESGRRFDLVMANWVDYNFIIGVKPESEDTNQIPINLRA